MELKHTKETVISVEYVDLQNFITKVYGLKWFDILESSNDTTYTYTVKIDELSPGDRITLSSAIRDCSVEYWCLDTILTDLCNKGHIEPGKYLVRVSW